MNIKQVFEQHPEGFTLNTNPLRIEFKKEGFYVSLTNNKFKDLEEAEEVFIRSLKVLNALSTNPDNKKVGGWKDREGNLYLDATLWVETEEEAIIIARLFQQKAYYDIKYRCGVEL